MKVNKITYRCPHDKQIYISEDPENGFYIDWRRTCFTVWECLCGTEVHEDLPILEGDS